MCPTLSPVTRSTDKGAWLDLRYTVTRYLYRPFSIPAAAWLARTRVTPTHVTWLSAAIAMTGAIAFAFDAYIAGALLSLIGVITDCVDGDLARITNRTSSAGAFLDSVLDRWTDAAMIVGLGLSDADRYGAAAAAALVPSFLTSYTRARAQSLGVDTPEGIGGRDVRILVLVVAALTGFVLAGLVTVAVLALATSVHRTVNGQRGLQQLDAAAAHANPATEEQDVA